MNRQSILTIVTALLVPTISGAQDVARRVAADAGTVQFHFAARAGVCGNGTNFMRVEDGTYYSSWAGGTTAGGQQDQCVAGPVRVVLIRDGSELVKIETRAGPLASSAEDGRDLGLIPAADAAGYLMSLAASLDGRPAREALLPAMLADGAVVTPALLTLATDRSRSRDVRRNAISWLSRRRAEQGGAGETNIARALDRLVRDRDESESVRSQVLSTISSLDRGAGIPILIALAGDADPWLSRQSFAIVARSGDPRARQFTRESIRRPNLAEESRVAAIQGLAGEFATSADYRMLREHYPQLDSDRARDAVLNAVAAAGGADNTAWILSIAQSSTEPAQRRRRAVSILGRSDDPKMKDALKGLIAER